MSLDKYLQDAKQGDWDNFYTELQKVNNQICRKFFVNNPDDNLHNVLVDLIPKIQSIGHVGYFLQALKFSAMNSKVYDKRLLKYIKDTFGDKQ